MVEGIALGQAGDYEVKYNRSKETQGNRNLGCHWRLSVRIRCG